MTQDEWKEIYVKTLMDRGNVDRKFAEDCYEAGLEDHDFEDDPVMVAKEEMTCWD